MMIAGFACHEILRFHRKNSANDAKPLIPLNLRAFSSSWPSQINEPPENSFTGCQQSQIPKSSLKGENVLDGSSVTTLLIVLVLGAALLHAVWNAMAKSGGKPEFAIASYQLVGAAVCACVIPWVPVPDPASWPFIFASVVIHNIYYFSLSRAYRAGDLSQVYPLLRGLAPVLVVAGAYVFAGEQLSTGAIIGIALVSIGIASLAFAGKHFGSMPPNARFWALTTSVLIACYTVVDGLGVRAAGNQLSYIVWLFLFEIVPIGCVLLALRRRQWFNYLSTNKATVLGGGIASSAAYGLVIYAMSLGPMAIVSSLRETSVIFAAVIGALVLREPFGKARIRAAILVAGGIIVMRLLS